MCVIRKMKLADLSQILEIERNLFHDPWPEKSFLYELQHNDFARTYIVEKENEIAGYIIAWYYARELHIGNVAVAQKYQGQGIGTLLVEQLLSSVEDCEVSFLEVRKNNYIAQRLYKKFGFSHVFTRKSYYSNGEDAILMAKYM